MKATKDYRMTKTTKRRLGTFTNKAERNLYKEIMIRAEVDNEDNKKKMLSSKKDKEPAV